MNKIGKTLVRIFAFLLAAIYLVLMLVGCGKEGEESARKDKLVVVTSIFPAYDFARAVGGGKADIKMLLLPGQEAHTFDASPGDIIAIENCDIFLCNGGESEAWVDKLVLSGDCKVVKMMECASGIMNEENELDEHIWMDPQKACEIIRCICDEFSKADEQNAFAYAAAAEAYIKKIEDLDSRFEDTVKSASRDTLVFADRFPARYFTARYNLKYKAAFPGCFAQTEASPGVLAELTDYVTMENISTIFTIELSTAAIAGMIQEQTGAEIKTFYSCQSISLDDFQGGETYLSLMERNLKSVKEALE